MLNESIRTKTFDEEWTSALLGRDPVPIIVAHAPEVASDGGGVVGLGRVRDGVELAEEDALLLERGERGGRGGVVEVRVL